MTAERPRLPPQCVYRPTDKPGEYRCENCGHTRTADCPASELHRPCGSQRPDVKPPPMASRAWSLAKALADFVASGCRCVGRTEYTRRLTICDTCEFRRGRGCVKCGCPLLTVKAKGAAFHCPEKKW